MMQQCLRSAFVRCRCTFVCVCMRHMTYTFSSTNIARSLWSAFVRCMCVYGVCVCVCMRHILYTVSSTNLMLQCAERIIRCKCACGVYSKDRENACSREGKSESTLTFTLTHMLVQEIDISMCAWVSIYVCVREQVYMCEWPCACAMCIIFFCACACVFTRDEWGERGTMQRSVEHCIARWYVYTHTHTHTRAHAHTHTHRWVELGMKEEWERAGAGNEPEDWADVIVKAGNVCACLRVCVCMCIHIYGALCVADVIVKAGNVCVRVGMRVCVCVHMYWHIWCIVCVCAEVIVKAGNTCMCVCARARANACLCV